MIRTNNSEYYNLFNSIPLGICIIDKNFIVKFWNKTIEDWTSIRTEIITGRELSSFFPRFNEPHYNLRLNNLFTGGPPVIFSSQFHRNLFKSTNCKELNRVLHITASSFNKTGNNEFSLIFTIKDITDIENLVQKYKEIKNKAIEEVERRKKVEIKLLNANKKLETLANIDQLTKLPNRRYFREKINAEINRVKRNANLFSIIFIDIDNFKKFNTDNGHECGDFVLKAVASFLTASIRKTDVVARWGGEEFIIILPETSIKNAYTLTEKLRNKIANKEFSYNDKKLKITMTFGISSFNPETDTVETVINRADNALGRGKKEGKNRTIIYS